MVTTANPWRVLKRLADLHVSSDDGVLLEQVSVQRGLEAVALILKKGLPDKEGPLGDVALAESLSSLAGFYEAHGRPEPGSRPDETGDRLLRSEMVKLSHGLADVADRVRLAASLRKARREAGFGLRELSRFSGVDHSYISRVERGLVPRPSDEIMAKLSAPLGLETSTVPAPESADPRRVGKSGGSEPPGLEQLGLHRSAVRELLKVMRDLPDEHVELLTVQARAVRNQLKGKRRR